jgi:hypothetical protein
MLFHPYDIHQIQKLSTVQTVFELPKKLFVETQTKAVVN